MSKTTQERLGYPNRRTFLKSAARAATVPLLANLETNNLFADAAHMSQVFRVNNCPIHDGALRHVGVDALLYLLSANGTRFYKTAKRGTLNGPQGLIAAADVVVLKVNAQWKCRGGTNTDRA